MWADEDWRSLGLGAQHLYMLILSHPTLTYAGVADWRAGRLAAMTTQNTAERVRSSAAELEGAGFVLVDEETEEILIRSFIKHDGLLKQPKLSVSMANAYAGVASQMIREVIAFELQKLHVRHPELPAWTTKQVQTILTSKATEIAAFARPFTPALTPAVTPTGGQALAEPTTTATYTATSSNEESLVHPSGERAATEYPEEFEQWWAEYPRKQAKPDALKAFKAARKTTDLATLLAGVRTYKLLNIGQEKSHLKMPAGWLRDRRWEDEQVAHTPEQPRATVTHIGTSGVKECKIHPGYPAGDWMNPCVRCDEDAKRERGEAIF